jgi:hypothetical protein
MIMDIDTLLAGHDPARRHPLPGPDSAEAVSLYRQIVRPGASAGTASRPRRRITIAVLTGAVAAGVAAGLTLTLLPAGPHPGGQQGSVYLTARQVLDKAAATALAEPVLVPRPDQFVYSKTWSPGGVYQSWLSVDGRRDSLVRFNGGRSSEVQLGCPNGHRQYREPGYNGKPYHPGPGANPKAQVPDDGPLVTVPCTPEPAYFPDMPTSSSLMPAYLAKIKGIRLDNLNDLGKTVGEMLEKNYILPAQRSALYEFLATIPGLTVEHRVHDISGRPGVGIAWSFSGGRDMIILDPSSYALLGLDTWGVSGQAAGDALQQIALVDQAGQLP